jgi:hypothetical protein
MKKSSLILILISFANLCLAKDLPKDEYSQAFINNNPEFVNIFWFLSDKDRFNACDEPNKTVVILRAIEQGLHPDPSCLEVESYVCGRCMDEITKSNFRGASGGKIKACDLAECPNTYDDNSNSIQPTIITPEYNSTSTTTNSESSESNGGSYSFTPSIPFSRFQESPCSHLGYNPYDDMEALDKKYCECENKYYRNMTLKILGGLALLSGIAYMVYLSRRKAKA